MEGEGFLPGASIVALDSALTLKFLGFWALRFHDFGRTCDAFSDLGGSQTGWTEKSDMPLVRRAVMAD